MSHVSFRHTSRKLQIEEGSVSSVVELSLSNRRQRKPARAKHLLLTFSDYRKSSSMASVSVDSIPALRRINDPTDTYRDP